MQRFFSRQRPQAGKQVSRHSQRSQFTGSLQKLEDRRLLTVFVVNTLADDVTAGDDFLSLREAIIAAETNAPFGDAVAGEADGDRIVFAPELDGGVISMQLGSFQISDDLRIGDDLTHVILDANAASQIFNIEALETYTLENLTLINGRAQQGGALHIQGNGKLQISGVTFRNNVANQAGGAIYSDSAVLVVDHSRMLANQAGISDGQAGRGGGIYATHAWVRIYDSFLFGNEAVLAGGGMYFENSNAWIQNSEIRDNAVKLGDGGGLALSGISGAVLESTLVIGNVAARNGGAVWTDAGLGRLIVRDQSTITNNSAYGNGAQQGGGGIYNQGSLVRVMDSEIRFNRAIGESGSGGGIFSLGETLTVRRSQVSGNQAALFGGGIAIASGRVELEQVTLGGPDTAANFAGLDGGGLHVDALGGTTIQIVASDVINNYAVRDGGGVWIGNGVVFSAEQGSRFQDNRAGSSVNGGGAIFNWQGQATIDNSQFFANAALGTGGLGGAILNVQGTLVITNSEFTFNNAQRGGGGIASVGGTLSVVDTRISSNLAQPGTGGGVFVANEGVAVFDGTQIAGNTAARGGGIATFDSRVVIKNDSSVLANRAESTSDLNAMGGGIFQQAGLVRVLDSSITDNEAIADGELEGPVNGGGIASLFGTLNTRRSSIVSNVAENGFGGGVFTSMAIATIHDTIVGGVGPSDGNRAQDGGGLYFGNGSQLSISGSTITQNVATQDGGGIFNDGNSTLEIAENTRVAENLAETGGGLYNAGQLLVLDSVFADNGAAVGGGISNQTAAIAVFDGTLIDGNAASLVGGGVHNAGIVRFQNLSEISNNIAADSGGGIYSEDFAITMLDDVTFFNNLPDDINV